ncbi:glycosyltransferase [Parapedobacter sp. ISTM3]|uniref:Glycosyltransferase involved in cell wall bisynthesis n=1 Tax=Parapedobacter luteus TaxID=623280 RepID=A0A1T5A6W5_9SPHI|nr:MULTISPECIES: glycosyltransferase [Parapedobacter]MBK1442222.1 glycosyltransferase [Parapedobacter sp. ISTM3]SKB30678.1 Glycosyltransferase involved in cell wall bisynthesis [Parapedobacter luteus]
MDIVLVAHPTFLGYRSIAQYTKLLKDGMEIRGHDVEVWTADDFFFRQTRHPLLKKWLGYIDQYLVFPITIKRRLKTCPKHTLFVFTDQALGPYVPLLRKRPHVIHCHDFLAQQSALGEIKENPTGITGKVLQAYIRRGFRMGKNFISVSEKTRNDLHRFLRKDPIISKVVYNGLNEDYQPFDKELARLILGRRLGRNLRSGYLLHVGSNHWYKNRQGVLEIYDSWRAFTKRKLPLVMVGATPDSRLADAYNRSPYKRDIYFMSDVDNELLVFVYAGAQIFLFPSLAEGFGWPIAEAMACGSPVITTNQAPMTEVAAQAGIYIPRRPSHPEEAEIWAFEAGRLIERVLELNEEDYQKIVADCVENAQRFNTNAALNCIETIYRHIV